MRPLALRALAVAAMLAAAACAGASPQQTAADDTTKAVYNDDLNAMQSHFDAALQKQITIDGVNSLSQKLHAFGAYKGVTQIAADPSSGRYDYNASFDNVTMAVHVRMDQDGKLAAYRIDVPQTISVR
jgi:ABC-type glycerol-3-phosphate transport system substrate-binding protein